MRLIGDRNMCFCSRRLFALKIAALRKNAKEFAAVDCIKPLKTQQIESRLNIDHQQSHGLPKEGRE